MGPAAIPPPKGSAFLKRKEGTSVSKSRTKRRYAPSNPFFHRHLHSHIEINTSESEGYDLSDLLPARSTNFRYVCSITCT
ncbi:hypothetical protein L1987_86795 [Smallanthus sonchifolius]|uniref:Uncharacterized protein n=1 Tax=Smallanthus sonchifolius TaxID=185202 RepID=A0ACB8Y0U0_9ASTR|nr:hypothetical protein L1987_86795 [Smallanthus sonchifolius]